VTLRPPGNPPAGTTFDFEVSDPYGNTDTATVDVTFQQPPQFVPPTPSDDIEVDVGDRVTFTILATDPDTADLTYGVEPLPDGASMSGQSGSFGWTTTSAQVGQHDLELTASDGAATIRRTITVTVDGPPGDTGVADASDGGMPDADTDTGDTGDTGDTAATEDTDVPPADTTAEVGPDSSPSDVIDDDASDVDRDGDVARPSIGDEGCRCSSTAPAPSFGWWALAFGGLIVWRRRFWR
jgi:MYXO-CTERM domain-containing protein